MSTDEKRLIDGLYNVILCQRNLHYVFDIPKPDDVLITPDKYECSMRVSEVPADKKEAIGALVDYLKNYDICVSNASIDAKDKTQKVLVDLISANVKRLIDYYQGLFYDED